MRRLIALAAGIALAFAGQPASADGRWLDAPVRQWNQPGADVPRLLRLAGSSGNIERCTSSARLPASAEDAQLAARGWWLVAPAVADWGIRVVTATADWDGMCRPMGYQQFAFAGGAFVGTLSPILMNSREDGAAGMPQVLAPIEGRFGVVVVAYRRYAPSDPLCCPSSEDARAFRVVEGTEGRWLRVESAPGERP